MIPTHSPKQTPPMSATEKVVLELLAKGIPMDVIEEGIRIASKRVAADIVSGKFEARPSNSGEG